MPDTHNPLSKLDRMSWEERFHVCFIALLQQEARAERAERKLQMSAAETNERFRLSVEQAYNATLKAPRRKQ